MARRNRVHSTFAAAFDWQVDTVAGHAGHVEATEQTRASLTVVCDIWVEMCDSSSPLPLARDFLMMNSYPKHYSCCTGSGG